MSEENETELEAAPVVGAVPPAETIPVAAAAAPDRPPAPVGVTVAKRTVRVAREGGATEMIVMDDADQLVCHPDIAVKGGA